MTRARWLDLPGARTPHALPRREHQLGLWLDRLVLALVCAAILAALAWVLAPLVLAAAAHEVRQARTAEVVHDCRPPVDTEQLHVVLVAREGRVAFDGCLYVGSRGTYRRTRHGMPEARP